MVAEGEIGAEPVGLSLPREFWRTIPPTMAMSTITAIRTWACTVVLLVPACGGIEHPKTQQSPDTGSTEPTVSKADPALEVGSSFQVGGGLQRRSARRSSSNGLQPVRRRSADPSDAGSSPKPRFEALCGIYARVGAKPTSPAEKAMELSESIERTYPEFFTKHYRHIVLADVEARYALLQRTIELEDGGRWECEAARSHYASVVVGADPSPPAE